MTRFYAYRQRMVKLACNSTQNAARIDMLSEYIMLDFKNFIFSLASPAFRGRILSMIRRSTRIIHVYSIIDLVYVFTI